MGNLLDGAFNQSAVSRVERGERAVTAVELLAFEKALNVPAQDLLAGGLQASLEARLRALMARARVDYNRAREAADAAGLELNTASLGLDSIEVLKAVKRGEELGQKLTAEQAASLLISAAKLAGIEDVEGSISEALDIPLELLTRSRHGERLEERIVNAVNFLG